MQKVINLLAIASTVVSAAVVGTGAYVYLNRASIIEGVKEQIMEQVTTSGLVSYFKAYYAKSN